MNWRGDMAGIAREHLPHDVAERWIGLLRPALGLDRAADGPVVGRLGGLPALPADVPWPVWEAGQGPLNLIASIDFGALPRVLDIPVPADGTLHFFYFDGQSEGAADDCYDDEPYHHGGTRLLYVPAGVPVAERPAPAGITPYPEVRMRAELIATAPDYYHAILPATFGEDVHHVHETAFDEAVREVRGGGPDKWYRHQIGGYSVPEQWPPEHRIEDGGTVLAVVGGDDAAGMAWGDCGSLYWIMRPSDIAELRFEGAAFTMQCL